MVDSRLEIAKALAQRFSLKCILNDNLGEVIDKVDGALIATSNHTHYPVARMAIEKSVPVLIEKPITTTYDEAIKLCELARTNNTFISVGYRTRHFPSVQLMKQLLDKGFFGKINHFHYEFGGRGGWSPVSGYNLDRKKSGGGVLVVSGTHFLDRMLYWFGEPKEIIYRDDSYGGVEANCKAELFFENGAGTFSGTFFMSKTIKLKNKFTLDSEHYFCELAESESDKITVFPKNDLGLKIDLSFSGRNEQQDSKDYFQIQLDEFVDNIIQKNEITVDGWFAARSIKLIEEMYQNRLQLDEPWRLHKRQLEKEHA